MRQFFAIVFVSAMLAACKSKTLVALRYNDDFVKKEKSLKPGLLDTEVKVNEYANANKFDSVTIVSQQMEDEVDEVINAIKRKPAPDVAGAEKFKESMLRYFGFAKNMYEAYKRIGNAETEQARDEERLKMEELLSQKEQAVSDMMRAQNEFAAVNSFRIE